MAYLERTGYDLVACLPGEGVGDSCGGSSGMATGAREKRARLMEGLEGVWMFLRTLTQDEQAVSLSMRPSCQTSEGHADPIMRLVRLAKLTQLLVLS